MRRGEIWTVAGGADYAGKPRPAVILQDDRFSETTSVTVCLFTSNAVDAPLLRVPVEPTSRNGLRELSHLMVDKVATVPRARIGALVGRLGDDDMQRLARLLVVFLGLAGASASTPTARSE